MVNRFGEYFFFLLLIQNFCLFMMQCADCLRFIPAFS